MTDYHHQNICARWKDLAFLAQHIVPTKIPLEPMPYDIKAVKDDLDAMIRYFDPLLLAYGEMLVANGMDRWNLDYFRDQLRNALDGNALYSIDEMADVVADELAEAAA